MTMFDILNPVYKKYKENKKKQMEKELLSKSFSGNIDSDSLLPKESKENAIDVKESKSVKQRFQEQFSEEDAKTVMDLVGGWDFSIQLPDGKMLNTTYKDLLEGAYTDSTITPGQQQTVNYEYEDTAGNKTNYTWNDQVKNDGLKNNKQGKLGNSYVIATLTTGDKAASRVCITSAKADTKDGTKYNDQADIALNIYSDVIP